MPEKKSTLRINAGNIREFLDEQLDARLPLPEELPHDTGDLPAGPYSLVVDTPVAGSPSEELLRAMRNTLALIADQDFEAAEMLYTVWEREYHSLAVEPRLHEPFALLYNEIAFCLKMNRAYEQARAGHADRAQGQLIECDVYHSRVGKRFQSPEAHAYAKYQHEQTLKNLNAIGTGRHPGGAPR